MGLAYLAPCGRWWALDWRPAADISAPAVAPPRKSSTKVRAVQSSPFPFFAARRRGGPGGGLGTPGLAPGPRPPRPHLRKK
jgi:hypothetical protein